MDPFVRIIRVDIGYLNNYKTIFSFKTSLINNYEHFINQLKKRKKERKIHTDRK